MPAAEHPYLDLPRIGAALNPDSPQSVYRLADAAARFLQLAAIHSPVEATQWCTHHLAAGMRQGIEAKIAIREREVLDRALRGVLPPTTIELIEARMRTGA